VFCESRSCASSDGAQQLRNASNPPFFFAFGCSVVFGGRPDDDRGAFSPLEDPITPLRLLPVLGSLLRVRLRFDCRPMLSDLSFAVSPESVLDPGCAAETPNVAAEPCSCVAGAIGEVVFGRLFDLCVSSVTRDGATVLSAALTYDWIGADESERSMLALWTRIETRVECARPLLSTMILTCDTAARLETYLDLALPGWAERPTDSLKMRGLAEHVQCILWLSR
jgi:hypothetical protein